MPYEWWIEGGKKPIEAGQLVGAARSNNMNPATTVYTLVHSYNGAGKQSILMLLNIRRVSRVADFAFYKHLPINDKIKTRRSTIDFLEFP